MKWFKSIFSIVLQNFRKWKYDCRIWIALFIVLIFIHSLTKGLSGICDYTGVKSSPWIFPFLYMQYYKKMLFFFPLILIFSNAPFIDKNQLYVLIRTGRNKWCIGQMLYIVVASALYFAFVMVFSIVLNLDCIEFTGEWGKLLNTLANTTMGTKFQLGLLYIYKMPVHCIILNDGKCFIVYGFLIVMQKPSDIFIVFFGKVIQNIAL